MDLKERLHSHLIQIVRDRNPYLASAGHFYVQQYIREQLSQWGSVEIDDFAVRGRIHHNLILNLRPQSPPRLGGEARKADRHWCSLRYSTRYSRGR